MSDQHPLTELGAALFGHLGRAGLLDALNVNERTFRRWLNGTVAIPDGVWIDARRLLTERAQLIERTLANLPKPP